MSRKDESSMKTCEISVANGISVPYSDRSRIHFASIMSVLEEPVSLQIDAPGAPKNDGTLEISPAPDTESISEVKMSKKAMKKAAKAERYQAFKLERRAREKQMQKEKRRLKAQKRAAGELDDSAELEEKARKRQKMSGFGGKIVLDLSFDKLMSEKVISPCNY